MGTRLPIAFMVYITISRVWKPTPLHFETTEISHNEWENKLHKEKTTGGGADRGNDNTSALSDKVKLLCGETVCRFQVKRYYYRPEHHTNKDKLRRCTASEQWCKANDHFLHKFSAVDPNWLHL